MKPKHNWKPETMDECSLLFMRIALDCYHNYEGKYRKKQIYNTIKRYAKIQQEVAQRASI